MDVTIEFLRALQDEFGGKIHVLPDNTSYFRSKQVQEFLQDTPIELTCFPRDSSDLECWRWPTRAPGNRFSARSTSCVRP